MTRHLLKSLVAVISLGVLLGAGPAPARSKKRSPEQCQARCVKDNETCRAMCIQGAKGQAKQCFPVCDKETARCKKSCAEVR